jgi:hypothetical protein
MRFVNCSCPVDPIFLFSRSGSQGVAGDFMSRRIGVLQYRFPSPHMVVFTFSWIGTIRPFRAVAGKEICSIDSIACGTASAHHRFGGQSGLLFRNTIQMVLEVDEGEQDGHDQVEPEADGLAAVIVIE